jgi:hypothetical protein
MEDPDYHVVTNFDFSWEPQSSSDRLIQLQPEYDRIESELIAALGITRELVTGEASYSGSRITLEILNTRYLLIREIFQNFIEKQLLLPMAVANDWYEIDEETNERTYYYPKLTFNRLTIRDNSEAFDALFQLYQKGSLPLKVIHELFNLDPDEMNDMLVDDLWSPRDPTFNEMSREVYTKVADKIAESTDVADRIIKRIGLTSVDEKGKPKLPALTDLNTGFFTPPMEESEQTEVGEAPEEQAESLETPAPTEGELGEEPLMTEEAPEEGAPTEAAPTEEGETVPVEETPEETPPEEPAKEE